MFIKVKYGFFEFRSEDGYPTPKITFDIANVRTDSQQYLSSKKTINLEGLIYRKKMGPHYGLPEQFTEDHSSQTLLNQAIKFKEKLLKTDIDPNKSVQSFAVIANNQSQPFITGSGYIEALNFTTEDSKAVNYIKYTMSIVLLDTVTGIYSYSTADPLVAYNVTSAQDTINIQPNWDQLYTSSLDLITDINATYTPTYTINRTVSAVGIRNGVSGALKEAERWISDRQKFYTFLNFLPLSQFALFDYDRNLEVDENNGSMSIRDTFLAKTRDKTNPWIETCNISSKINDDFSKEISLNGEIQGLHPVNDLMLITGTPNPMFSGGKNSIIPLLSGLVQRENCKYHAALSGYNLVTGLMYNRASVFNNTVNDLVPTGDINRGQFTISFPGYNQKILNPIPISISEGLDPINGKITYSYTFNDRPISLISGAISETLTVNDTNPTPRHSEIPVIGRRLGPLVYFYTSSSGQGTRTATYEGVFKNQTGFKQFKIDVNIIKSIENLLNNYKPIAPYSGYETSNTENLNLNENRIRKSIVWTYTKCGN